MENKKGKVALNDELLDKVSGGWGDNDVDLYDRILNSQEDWDDSGDSDCSKDLDSPYHEWVSSGTGMQTCMKCGAIRVPY